MRKKDRAELALNRLKQKWPNAHCELNHKTPFQLLIATILSAQCTDERVNKVTPQLFSHYPTAQEMAIAPIEHLEELIHSTGFYKNKAKNIKKCSSDLVSKFDNQLPSTIEELTSLAGVGRKTANVLLGNAFNINAGIVVDTHVRRISNLLNLTKSSNPEIIERDLIKIIPQKDWTIISHLFIFLGRRICVARRPQCDLCFLNDFCPSAFKTKKK